MGQLRPPIARWYFFPQRIWRFGQRRRQQRATKSPFQEVPGYKILGTPATRTSQTIPDPNAKRVECQGRPGSLASTPSDVNPISDADRICDRNGRSLPPEARRSNTRRYIQFPENPDPQTHRVLRARTPAMEGPTPAMESPRILRVEDIFQEDSRVAQDSCIIRAGLQKADIMHSLALNIWAKCGAGRDFG